MDARKANDPVPSPDDSEWRDEPISEAEWLAMPEAERQAILEAEAAVDRGEWVSGESVIAELRQMAAAHRARAAAARARSR